MNTRKLLVTLSLFCGLLVGFSWLNAAHAKKRLTVINKSNKTIKIKTMFIAGGCAGIVMSEMYVCTTKTKKVPAGKTVTFSYAFKWGTTKRQIFAICKGSGKWHVFQKYTGKSKTITYTGGKGCKAF